MAPADTPPEAARTLTALPARGHAAALAREPAFYDNLALTLVEAWRLLEDGVLNASNAFHQPVLATRAIDDAADARVVVLRHASQRERLLRFHTDVRAGKVAELRRDPRATVVAYDAASKVQLRLSGTIELHHGDALAQRLWADTRRYSRQCYRVAQASGSVLAHPAEADFQPTASDDCGAEHFAALRFVPTVLEWLYLAAVGHRRARYSWDGSTWQGVWLVP